MLFMREGRPPLLRVCATKVCIKSRNVQGVAGFFMRRVRGASGWFSSRPGCRCRAGRVQGRCGGLRGRRWRALRRRAVPTWGVFLNEYEQGGGPLIDIATHALDLTLWMMDNYKPKMVVGTKYRKLADQTHTANAWGEWDPKQFTVEDSAFGFVVMENGATVSVESSWALNIADTHEAICLLAGDKGGADMMDGLRMNYVKHDRQIIERPSFDAGGAAYFDGDSSGDPSELEARAWINAVLNDTEPPTKASQALVVTRILEAIYESAATGKAVYFED